MSYPVFYVPAGDVLPILFASYDKDDGSSITLTGLAATDIEIYKDGGVTQRASDAGYTLLDTDGIDFDGITGIHGFSIDTGDNTDASFYTVGSWFHVVVSAVTIDAVAVSFIAAAFRIMKAEGVAGVPKGDVDAWLGTAAATPTVAGVPEVDLTHVGGATTNVAALATNVDAILTDTSTTLDDLIDTEIATIVSELAKVPKSDGTASWNATALAAIQSEANDALVAYDPPTKAELDSAVAPLALEATLATVDNLIDTEISTLITMLTGIVPVNGTIGATGNSTTALHLDGIAWADDGPNSMLLTIQDVSTGLYYSRWIEDFATTGDLATVATLPFTPEASVDKYWLTPVRADVTGGSGLDAAGVRAAIGMTSANLDTQIAALPTAAEVVDEWETQSQADPTGFHVNVMEQGGTAQTANDDGADINTLITEMAKVPKSDSTVTWNATALASMQQEATDALNAYDPPTKTEMDSAFTEIKGATWDSATDTLEHIRNKETDIEADTNELQGDWANGGRLDLILDARASQTSVDDLPTNAELTTALAAADDAVLAAIAALNNLSAAQVNAEVVDALATDTYPEPTGVPAATDDLATKIGYLYMALRNQLTVTATKKTFYDDSGAAEWEKDLSDDTTTYTESEANAI